MSREAHENVFERHRFPPELAKHPALLDREAEDVLPRVALRRARHPDARLAGCLLDLDRNDSGERREAVPRRDRTREYGMDDGCAGQPAAELRRRALGHDPPPVDDENAVADRLDLGQDVRREQHGAIPTEVANRLADLDDLDRVEPDRRLVEDEDPGLVHERSGERRALPEPLGEVLDLPVGHFGEEAALEGFGHAGAHEPARDTLEPGPKREVLADPHLGIRGRGLRQVAERGARRVRLAHDVVPGDAGRAGARREEARQDPHRRGLPGAVGAEEADDLPFPHGERHVVHRQAGRVSLREILDFDHAIPSKTPLRNRGRIMHIPGAGHRGRPTAVGQLPS